jgi:thioesterase domain-containing protein/acyl carrier protein
MSLRIQRTGERRRRNDKAGISHAAVARAWRKILDLESLNADQKFDRAGGDSLRLHMLIFMIEEATGITLPMDRCHVALRPSEFVQIVEDALRPQVAPPEVVSPDTIFLLPGTGGDVPLLSAFRAGCAPHLSFATLDFPEWPELVEQNLDFADLVRRATDDIRHRSPPGPVRLVGFSLGGYVAYAVALTLRAEGRKIEFLGIFDTDADPAIRRGQGQSSEPEPAGRLGPLRRDLRMLRRAAREGWIAGAIARIAGHALMQPGRRRLLRFIARHRDARLPAGFAYFLNRYLQNALEMRLARDWGAGLSAAPPPIDCRTVLFRSEGHRPEATDDLGWRGRFSEFRVVHVPGDHLGMLRPPHLAPFCAGFVDIVATAAAQKETAKL